MITSSENKIRLTLLNTNIDRVDHHDYVKDIMFTYVLRNIYTRKKKDKIKDGTSSDIFPNDIYENYKNYIKADTDDTKVFHQRNRYKYIKTKLKTKDTNIKPESKLKGKGGKVGTADKPKKKPAKEPRLKSPINIQYNWLYYLEHLEVVILDDARKYITNTKGKVSEGKFALKSKLFNLILRVNTMHVELIGKSETNTHIEKNIKDLTKVYSSTVPDHKSNLAEHIATTIIEFIRILAYYAETDVWNSISKSCNINHIVIKMDTFRKMINYDLPNKIIEGAHEYASHGAEAAYRKRALAKNQKVINRALAAMSILKKRDKDSNNNVNNDTDGFIESNDSDNDDSKENPKPESDDEEPFVGDEDGDDEDGGGDEDGDNGNVEHESDSDSDH